MQTNKKNEALTSSIRTKAKKSTRIFNKVFHAKKCPTFPGNPVHDLCFPSGVWIGRTTC